MELREPGTRYIYRFGGKQAEGDGSMRDELGGKGVGLAEMTKMGIPVPPGFTISTLACRHYLEFGAPPESLEQELEDAIQWLELEQAEQFGGERNPLLVSVRSGAAVSMPGMMDTVLNLGINDANVEGLGEKHNSLEFALDSYQRLLQMFGAVVLRMPRELLERAREAVASDHDLPEAANAPQTERSAVLRATIAAYRQMIERHTGKPFPMDPRTQLQLAVGAVFQSWNNERAKHYRRMQGIPDTAGTAVTVQAMVFGNCGSKSGTGVGFTRDPNTGERKLFGEFLAKAQGEDIVAGLRTPLPIAALEQSMPEVYRRLRSVVLKLEKHYRDIQDFEFTVQNGELFLLQTRAAQRSPLARIRTAVEMAEEGVISQAEALLRVSPSDVEEVLSRRLEFDPDGPSPIAKGLPASPSSVVGRLAVNASRAVAMAGPKKETPVILVRQETTADDIHGMDASVGFLTAQGGATSHAAVVARGLGKCCITGAVGILVDEAEGTARIGEHLLKEGDWLSLDGSTGRVFLGRLRLQADDPAQNAWLARLLAWAREMSVTVVRANADTPQDAARARHKRAAGIGLCRTEHMFFAPDRLSHVRAMILASTKEERAQELAMLLPAQRTDFEQLFRAMPGLPVTIRLIDPPLHEFLPAENVVRGELSEARQKQTDGRQLRQLEELLARVQQLSESNPMLGLRGCRLGIVYPEIVVMQITAILEAALHVRKTEGYLVRPEIMVPLVACVEEMRHLRRLIDETAQEIFLRAGEQIGYRVGAMVELPRAAVCAGAIAGEVDFFSMGTNDLTQMTFGFSRDDAQKYLDAYLELGLLKKNPFQTIDREGVGSLIRMAIQQARAANREIKIGVCGEHGGDPESIEFFQELGVDYVSCSPARIPVAQLSVARTTLRHCEVAFA